MSLALWKRLDALAEKDVAVRGDICQMLADAALENVTAEEVKEYIKELLEIPDDEDAEL